MTKNEEIALKNHPVVSHQEWIAARTAFLAKEKEFTRLRDELSRARRALPWEKVEKTYLFEGPRGKESLADLFAGRSQLVVYQFMFAPEQDAGCKHCSFWADNFNSIGIHLNHRDLTFVAVSRAPLAKIEAFKKRMGWGFHWVSSHDTDYNYDFQASFRPEDVKRGAAVFNYAPVPKDSEFADREGISVFYKDPSAGVLHTYSCYGRGIDMMNTAYHYLDLAPKGRDEESLKFTQAWVEYHDQYKD